MNGKMKMFLHLLVLLVGTSMTAAPAVPDEEALRTIDIHTDGLSLVFAAAPGSVLTQCHFGARIDNPAPLAVSGTGIPAYPTAEGFDFRNPALRVTHADGDPNTELRYVSHSSKQLADGNVTETVIRLNDRCQALDVELLFTAYARENVITTHVLIHNREKGAVELRDFYSSALSLRAGKYLLTHLYGAWAREAQVEHTQLDHGSKSIESSRGVRTTHTEQPAFLLTLDSDSFSEDYGEVIAGALAWSGNFRLNFEVDESDRLTVLAGANPAGSEYTLRPDETFRTPEMIYTYSNQGAGGASRNLHDWARHYGVYRNTHTVPTLLNSWEGAYFNFDFKTLAGMIDDAAAMGLEMFVLDDGWFGNKYPRNSSGAGLGDWQVNVRKLPEGIDSIASYAHARGLKFGIWIEPEMVNPKSELAERHPDWIVRMPGREAPLSRNQWLLDLTNPAVQDFVFGVFDQTMQLSKKIDYIKWDANRNACNIGSAYLPATEQTRFWFDYTQGFLPRAGAHPGQIPRCPDPGLRLGWRTGRIRSPALFRRGVDQRQYRSTLPGPNPVRHEPLLSGVGHGSTRLGSSQPPDRKPYTAEVPFRHGVRRASRHGAAAPANGGRRESLRPEGDRLLQGLPGDRFARRPLSNRNALRPFGLLCRAVRLERQTTGRSLHLLSAIPRAELAAEIPASRS